MKVIYTGTLAIVAFVSWHLFAGAQAVPLPTTPTTPTTPATTPSAATVPTAQTASLQALREALSQRVNVASSMGRIGVSVRDAVTGEVVFAFNEDVPLNPASNMKVLTAALALRTLGPEHRFRTSIHGALIGTHIPAIWLRGEGDALLDRGDLMELAREVAARGARTVDEVVVDASFFDAQMLPPAFEQQPNEVSPFRAAISPISVDENAYMLRIAPGTLASPSRAVVDGAGYFVVTNRLITVESGAPQIVADQRVRGEQMELRLSGQIALSSGMLSYRRRIENPTQWAGHLLVELLSANGVRVTGGVRVSQVGVNGVPLLAQHESLPLPAVLSLMGKQSDNFVAEMVFRAVASTTTPPATTAESVAALRAMLEALQAFPSGTSLVNGSGLFRGNLIAPSTLARVLVDQYQHPETRSEFVGHLAIAGVDGTLVHRFQSVANARRIRAKTGTLNDAIALSGYVMGTRADNVFVFSILCNDVAGQQGQARQFADGIAETLLLAATAHQSRE